MENVSKGTLLETKMKELSTPKEHVDFIKSCPIALIHFGADWNNYDNQMKEQLRKLENSYSQFVCFGSVNVDQKEMFSICQNEKVINLPALVYYKKGDYIETEIGLTQTIEEKLKLLLA